MVVNLLPPIHLRQCWTTMKYIMKICRTKNNISAQISYHKYEIMGHYYIRIHYSCPMMTPIHPIPQGGWGGRGRNSIYKHSCGVPAGFTAVQGEKKLHNTPEIFLTECFQLGKLQEKGSTHRWHMTKKNFSFSHNFSYYLYGNYISFLITQIISLLNLLQLMSLKVPWRHFVWNTY